MQASNQASEESKTLRKGKILHVLEGKKRFSKVYVDDESFTYMINKKKSSKEFLRCSFQSCSGRATYSKDTGCLQDFVDHNHDAPVAQVAELKFLESIKSRAEKERTSLRTIYNEELTKIDTKNVPPFEKLRSTLDKRRRWAINSLGNQATSSAKDRVNSEKEICSTHLPHLEKKELATIQITCKQMVVMEGIRRSSSIYADENSYCYRVNKKKLDGTLNLRCYNSSCRGSGIYSPATGSFTKLVKHSHYPDLQIMNKLRFIQSVKKRSELENTNFSDIYNQEFIRFGCDSDTPSFEQMESSLRKIRQNYQIYCDEELKGGLSGQTLPFRNRRAGCPSPTRSLSSSEDKEEDLDQESLNHSEKAISKTEFLEPNCKEDNKNLFNSKMEIIEGKKRFSKVYVDTSSHLYRCNRSRQDANVLLRCYIKTCKSTGMYDPSIDEFQLYNEHCHKPPVMLASELKFLHHLKVRAETETTPLRSIYDEESARAKNWKIPAFSKVQSTLLKRRNLAKWREPQTMEEFGELLVNNEIAAYHQGNLFKILKGSTDGEIVLLFQSTIISERLVEESEGLHINATFDVKLPLFENLVVLNLWTGKQVVPFLFALVIGKSASSYLHLLSTVKEVYPVLHPATIFVNFEDELLCAVKKVFNESSTEVCWFHMVQRIWHEVTLLSCARSVFLDHDSIQLVKNIISLSLIPSSDNGEATNFLAEKIASHPLWSDNTKSEFLRILKYLEAEWLHSTDFEFSRDNLKFSFCLTRMQLEILQSFDAEVQSVSELMKKLKKLDRLFESNWKDINNRALVQKKLRLVDESVKLLLSNKLSYQDFFDRAALVIPKIQGQNDFQELLDAALTRNPSEVPGGLTYCEIHVDAEPL